MRKIEFSNGRCLNAEGIDFEAKECADTLPRSFWPTYSSFANTFGGTIVLGLAERDGGLAVTGVQDPDKVIKELWDLLNDPKKVSIDLLTEKNVRKVVCDGKVLIAVDVPRAPVARRPVYINGSLDSGSYRRNGEGDYHCAVEDLAELFRDASAETQDSRVIEDLQPGDLVTSSLAAYRQQLKSFYSDHPWVRLSDSDFLRMIGAVKKDRRGELHPTMAGLLMFGAEGSIAAELPEYHLDCFEFDAGQTDWKDRIASHTGDWSGNLFDFYGLVMNRIVMNTKRPFRLEKTVRIDENGLVKAQREMVVNALVHADYHGRGGVRIELRPESFTARNPGLFRIPLAKAEEGGFSSPRNLGLAQMFALIGAVARAGSGIPRIISACREFGLPAPSFSETVQPSTAKVRLFLAPNGEESTDEQVKDLMRTDGSITMETIASRLSVSKSTVYRTAERLKKTGEIERIGGTRGRWQVCDS